jgi:two-component system, sensor histidine kinase and response regulator
MKSEKPLVLVVDDIPSNIEFIKDILATMVDIEIEGVFNGASALVFITKRKPDLILMDVSMPQMDGFEVCRTLKENEKYADIPIIFLTARVQKEDIVRGFESGAVDYISKPFNLSELHSRVKTHLDLSLKTRELQLINQTLEGKIEERTHQLSNANKNLSKANEMLSKMYDELSALDNAKDDFIAHINHELRTPLNGILGYTSLLEVSITNEGRESLNAINVLVARLINVSEIALLLTELRTSDNKINIREISIFDIVRRSIPAEAMQRKNIEIRYNNINDSQFVMAEPRLLKNCFSIVMDNANKYSPVNGIISISGRDNDDYFSVDIEDSGPGFSSNALSNLFELFKADNLEHRSYGFGLGLATAKKIIDLLGGKITIRNRGQGASVVLHLKKP